MTYSVSSSTSYPYTMNFIMSKTYKTKSTDRGRVEDEKVKAEDIKNTKFMFDPAELDL